MRRRNALHAALVLGVIAAGVWFALRTAPPGPPTVGPSRANFARLRAGMTLPEVEAVLGPGDFNLSSDTRRDYFVWKGPDGWCRVWLAGDPVRTVDRLEFDPTLTR
jgi:hypothetical protein